MDHGHDEGLNHSMPMELVAISWEGKEGIGPWAGLGNVAHVTRADELFHRWHADLCGPCT